MPLSRFAAPARRWTVPLLLSLALLGGCGNDDDDPPATTGSVAVQVTDAATGAPVANATVSSGTQSVATDAQGQATLNGVGTGERVVVRARAAAHADGLETVSVTSSSTASLAIQVLPIGTQQTLAAASGGTVTVPGSSAQVTLPANGFVVDGGGAYTGPVTVTLTPIDPTQNVAAMPGEYLASTPSGTAMMESFGALSVQLTGASGEKLNLASGQTATVRIPAASRATLPATIPLFYFNETTGLWVQEGNSTLTSGAQPYYEGTVSHFSVWNADQIAATVHYLSCVKDAAGNPVAGVRLLSDGIDYSGTASALSDANGRFELPVKLGGRATVIGQKETQLTNTVSVGPLTADETQDTCLVLSSTSAAISVKLTWGQAPADVDSHLYLPDGSHVYFGADGSLAQAPFANLDVDDTSSFGPEVITVTRLMVGTYTYRVHNYTGSYAPGLTGSPVRVEARINGATTVYAPPAGEVANSTDTWTVFSFTVDAQCRISVTRIDTWGTLPTDVSPTTPAYCTP